MNSYPDCSNDEHKTRKRIFGIVARIRFGDWSDPIQLPQIRGIDPSFFFDDDGRAYIVSNGDAPDGKNESLLVENLPARYLSTAEAGGFTGTTIGLYAVE